MIRLLLKLFGVFLVVIGLLGLFRYAGAFTIVASDVAKGASWFGILCPSGIEVSPSHFIVSKGPVVYDIDFQLGQSCTFSRREECPSNQVAWIKAAPGSYTGYDFGCQSSGTTLTVTTTVYPDRAFTTTTAPQKQSSGSTLLWSALAIAGGLVLFFVGG